MSGTVRVVITPEVVALATTVAKDLQRAVGLDEPWTSLRAYLDGSARVRQLQSAEAAVQLDLRRCRILEIGSGMGMLAVVARKLGLDLAGCEPAANAYASLRDAGKALLTANDVPEDTINCSSGERLPWADDIFDVVLSFQTLEHVRDQRLVLAEAMRVLKPGGRLYAEMPSHRAFVEGHFGIAWLPPLAYSKALARAYVYAWRRNPRFLDELNLLTPSRIRRWILPLARSAHVCSEPPPGPSPSTEGVHVETDGPQVPAGKRFSGISAGVRDGVRHPRVRPALMRLGLGEQIVLMAIK